TEISFWALNVSDFCCKVKDIRTHSFCVNCCFYRLYNNTECVFFVHPEGTETVFLEKRSRQGLNGPWKNLEIIQVQ
ncbi:MAG: hypothetical protein L0I95_09030, partial [Tetragenococcus koreensis]|nr:hypothetical protein [Tetragenococcus koreensis]MDN6270612.1 hypothetical protein [Tetragenococcus koreensis]